LDPLPRLRDLARAVARRERGREEKNFIAESASISPGRRAIAKR